MFYQDKNSYKVLQQQKKNEYLPLGKELKAQTDITKKQYQNLGDTYVFDKKT